jgi:hypothetical protein
MKQIAKIKIYGNYKQENVNSLHNFHLFVTDFSSHARALKCRVLFSNQSTFVLRAEEREGVVPAS